MIHAMWVIALLSNPDEWEDNLSGTNGQFIGPEIVLEGHWGHGKNQFGYQSEDTADVFPKMVRIDSSGRIFIADPANRRINVYGRDGFLMSNITPKNETRVWHEWPAYFDCDSNGDVYAVYWNESVQKYGITGELLWESSLRGGGIEVLTDDTVIIAQGNNSFVHIDPDGAIIKREQRRPAEIGIIEVENSKQEANNGKQKKLLATFPDKTYSILVSKYVPSEDKLARDARGNLYLGQWVRDRKGSGLSELERKTIGQVFSFEAHHFLTRYGRCSGSTETLELPRAECEMIGIDSTVGERDRVLLEFGFPTVAPNGDIHAWRRTPETFAIVKWCWFEGPDAPRSLWTKTEGEGIRLWWEPPAEDAQKVKGFEIERADDVCGTFETVGTVEDALEFTDTDVPDGDAFFYRVRAIHESGFSAYSNTVLGKRGTPD